MENNSDNKLPVRIYQTEDRIMIAAPMPGLEPGNIHVSIADDRVVLHGEERGPGQHDVDLLLAEWTVGPYHRELTLPQPVSGQLTNATFGNGVLVLSMPKLDAPQADTHAHFELEAIDGTRGERIGHSGRDMQPTTTAEHRQRMGDSHATTQ